MFGFLFRSTTYFIIWQKFKHQIVMLIISFLLIGLIGNIYDDLFKVLKVTNKESVLGLLFIKWFLISGIVGFNIYKFKKIKLEDKEEISEVITKTKQKVYPQQSKEILNKKTLLSSTDRILNKYTQGKKQ